MQIDITMRSSNLKRKDGEKGMKNYGTIQSMVQPEPMVIDEFSVWKNSNIKEISVPDPETDSEHTEYQYDCIQYTKDEYIMQQATDITEAQKGMCELYEMILK